MLDDFGGKLGAALRRFFRADALHAYRDIGGVEGITGGCGIERLGDDRRRDVPLFSARVTCAGYQALFGTVLDYHFRRTKCMQTRGAGRR